MRQVSQEQMARIDEKVPEKYVITISRMMENTGYQIAEVIRSEIDPNGVTLYAGKGKNGGDDLAEARRLYLWGYNIEVVLATEELDGIRKEELEILKELDVIISEETARNNYSVALEGLIGYNLKGDVRPPFDSVIKEINRYETGISIDIPTGVDADTGKKAESAVDADHTVTLAMPKKGMNEGNSGSIWIADISTPPEAYREFGFSGDNFDLKSLVKYDSDEI